MIVLDAMYLEVVLLVYSELHEHDRCKEGKHYGCCGRGRRAFVAGYLPVMIMGLQALSPSCPA
jgi:hypothetical protein